MTSGIDDLMKLCVERCGTEATEDALRSLLDGPDVAECTSTLTIIANVGVHEIPEKLRRGEVYSASQGNWQVSSDEDLSREVRRILVGVARKLRERPWQVVYLIPTGHPVVSMQIKALVYRALRLNTVDVAYLNGVYYTLHLDQREVALEAGAETNDASADA